MTDITIKFYNNHSLYHKIAYVLLMSILLLTRVMGFSKNSLLCFSFFGVVLFFAVLDSVFYHTGKYEADFKIFTNMRFIEFCAYCVFLSFAPYVPTLFVAVFLVMSIDLSEYIIFGSHFDRTNMFIRRVMIFVPMFLNLCLSLKYRSESVWFCYVLVLAILVVSVYSITEWIDFGNDLYENFSTKLHMEADNIIEQNNKLQEYQEKVKSVNEKVNYQKIELAKVINDLEQMNNEIESQNDVMRYMASSFDISKNVNVIIDSIMDTKKAKLCAVFLDKELEAERHEDFFVKTDYSLVERKLKKEVESIYKEFREQNNRTTIYKGDELKHFRFVNDVNMNSMAILALGDEESIYGIMMIGSDNEDFFDTGVTYYETCIVEFNVSVKSTQLYLKNRDMARKDGLTGIYNRVYFGELFANAAAHARESKQPIAVALFDIDKFKNVNDTYGHLVGDKVIKMVASIDDKYAKQYNGFACRYGGEEFLLVLPGHNEKTALPILEAMHEEIRNTTVQHEEKTLHVNVCIGLSSFPNLCDNTDILVNRADKSMYYGKKHGRGRLVVDNPDVDDVLES